MDHDGLVVLDYATLRDAGVPVDSTDPRRLHLWHAEQGRKQLRVLRLAA